MKKVLVVGGAGYIGGITVDLLQQAGFVPTVYDNLLYESRYFKDCDFVFGDVRDTEKLAELARGYKHIVWLAAIVGDGACVQQPQLTREVNVEAVRRFLAQTRRRIIYTSTCSVYGAQKGLLDEESALSPQSLYARSKLAAEQYVLKNNGLVFRLGTVFGLGDRHARLRLDLVVNYMTLRAVLEGQITILGGEQWRALIAAKDVAGYLVEACESDITGLFNITYRNIQIADLGKEIKAVFPRLLVKYKEKAEKDLCSYRVKNQKAKEVFSFEPKTSIQEEVVKLKKLFEEQRIKDVEDNIYYNTHYFTVLTKNWDEKA